MAIFDRLQNMLFGAAVGRAASDSVGPVLEPVKQHAWKRNALRVLDVGHLAELVARGFASHSAVQDQASRQGFDGDKIAALAALAQSYPGLSEALTLRRRDLIDDKALRKIISRHGIPGEYHNDLIQLQHTPLDPAQTAAAIHRGLIPDPGLLKGEQPSGARNVESYPVYQIDAIKTAGAAGLSHDQLGVLVGLQGLPMGPHEAAQAHFRGIITKGDYIAAFNESNNRNEWAEAIFEQTRQIPTARDFFENALRGYHDLEWAQREAERHGMSPADSLVIYQNQGRPMNLHTITQALARGGKFEPEPGELTDPYMASIVEGNLKPAYYDLAHAHRYSYPSAFFFKTLQSAGVLNVDQAEQRYLEIGWPPDLARQVAEAFDKSNTTAASSGAKKGVDWAARGQGMAFSDVHAAVKKGLPAADGIARLEAIEVPAAQAQKAVHYWTAANP